MTNHKKPFEILADQIIAELERGNIPWERPWKSAGLAGLPKNLLTHKPYRGINIMILNCAGQKYESVYWLTYRQAKELGGTVKECEHGTPILFWSWYDKTRPDDTTDDMIIDRIPFLRYYTVFNVSQCSIPEHALPPPPVKREFDPITEAENIINDMRDKPEVLHKPQDRAFYRKSTDQIFMPMTDQFIDREGYYDTLFHELIHSTGHANRLDRKSLNTIETRGDEQYSKEELIAECGGSMLAGLAGIKTDKTFRNNTAYIASWLKVLKDDKRMIIYACGQAQKAVDYVLGVQHIC